MRGRAEADAYYRSNDPDATESTAIQIVAVVSYVGDKPTIWVARIGTSIQGNKMAEVGVMVVKKTGIKLSEVVARAWFPQYDGVPYVP